MKKIEVQESAPFPSVAPLKKIDVKESTPLPVPSTRVQKEKEGEGQREPETKILTEMFYSRDETGRQIPTRLEAFLAIVRLEKHWGKPLDEDRRFLYC